MAASKSKCAYIVVQKVGLVHPLDNKVRITPESGKFTPESLCPDNVNRGKKAIKRWKEAGFVEACLLEDPEEDLDEDLEIDESESVGESVTVAPILPVVTEKKVPVTIGKKIWIFPAESLAACTLDQLNLMIQDKADQEDVALPESHPYKTEKGAIKFLSKDL